MFAVSKEEPSSAASLAASVVYVTTPLILSRQTSTPFTYTTTPSSRLIPNCMEVKAEMSAIEMVFRK